MNIESLEINLLKASEIKDGDVIIVKIKNSEKSKIDKNYIQDLYKKITDMIKKEIPIYFFPSSMSIEIIKKSIENQSKINKNSDK